MVAVSYPDRFQVAAGEEVAEVAPEARTGGSAAARSAWPRRRWFRGYSPWGLGYDPYWDPFISSSYWLEYGAYGYGRYPPYGNGPYAYGGFGGGYRAPSVIVIQPPTVTDRSTLSRNRGVVRSGGGGGADSGLSRSPERDDSARRAAPRSSRGSSPSRAAPSPSQSSSGGGSARAAPRSSGGSSPSRAAPSPSRSPSGSGGGSGNGRRARPR